MNHLWHGISVHIRLNAQNHHFTTSQEGSFQMPVKENPTPKCFIPKRGFFIHVIEKFWRQAQRDPRAHTGSGAAASSTALSIMLASFSGFLCWQTVAAALNLLSDLLWAQGERELRPPPPVPRLPDCAGGLRTKRIYLLFTVSGFVMRAPLMVARGT